MYNIAEKTEDERNKINVDLAASGVAYRERLNIPVIPKDIEEKQPEYLKTYFRERLEHYRQVSKTLPKADSPEYASMRDDEPTSK
ncbi:DNA polymerase III subunit theta [Dickeya oryzae]|uniref:DNA polymerase III subunit theta n=1 Tax=Dickeya oryzae TaxID=1240404 RepID=A0AB39IRP3_9GAMM|nr:DNA polymerase III subunit theta [Dickeya oryzae]MCA6990784.1 DNA polymerase III subunit theta [Dickeya oryzae]